MDRNIEQSLDSNGEQNIEVSIVLNGDHNEEKLDVKEEGNIRHFQFT